MKKYSLSQLDVAFKVLPDDHPLRSEISQHIEEKVDEGTNPDGSLRPNKAKMDQIQKGRKGGGSPIGTIKEMGGRPYIKTSAGWKYHGKGTGAKAQAHAAGSKMNSGELDTEIGHLTKLRDAARPQDKQHYQDAIDRLARDRSTSMPKNDEYRLYLDSVDHEREANDTGNSPRLRDLHRNLARTLGQIENSSKPSMKLRQQVNDELMKLDEYLKESGSSTKPIEEDKSDIDPYEAPHTGMTEDHLNEMLSGLRNEYANTPNTAMYKVEQAGLRSRIRKVEKVLKEKQAANDNGTEDIDAQFAAQANTSQTRLHPTNEQMHSVTPQKRERNLNKLNDLPVGGIVNVTLSNGDTQLYKKVEHRKDRGGMYVQTDVSGRSLGSPSSIMASYISKIERRDELEDEVESNESMSTKKDSLPSSASGTLRKINNTISVKMESGYHGNSGIGAQKDEWHFHPKYGTRLEEFQKEKIRAIFGERVRFTGANIFIKQN